MSVKDKRSFERERESKEIGARESTQLTAGGERKEEKEVWSGGIDTVGATGRLRHLVFRVGLEQRERLERDCKSGCKKG